MLTNQNSSAKLTFWGELIHEVSLNRKYIYLSDQKNLSSARGT